MRTALLAAAALSVMSATPAMAATFVAVDDQAYFTFDGTQPGTSANLLLTLTGVVAATSTFTFDYTLTNTSDQVLNPTSRIPGFGFNDNIDGGATGSASGDFAQISFGNNFSDGLGTRDVCVFAQNCTGGSGGATFGDPAIGSFTIDYALDGLTEVSFTDFAIHYISVGATGNLSGTGTGEEGEIPDPQGGPVPEPATWAMMLLGFGAIGSAMRRRRPDTTRVRYNFA